VPSRTNVPTGQSLPAFHDLASPGNGLKPRRARLVRTNLHTQIVDAIGSSIVEGRFGTDGVLPVESELAHELGVSRNALREAVKVLVSKRMVDVRPKHGTRVLPMDEWNLLDRDVLNWHSRSELRLRRAFELVEFRLVVEPRAAALAAKRGTTAEIDAIDKACTALEACVQEPQLVPERDIVFHRSIHRASHNAILNHLGTLTSSLMQIQVLMTTQEPGSFERGLPLHRSLTEAIKARDAAGAEEVSRRLVQMPYDDLAARLSVSRGDRL
jgi:GntR family transcriptional regulator, galactonate operon transcriptional repressor